MLLIGKWCTLRPLIFRDPEADQCYWIIRRCNRRYSFLIRNDNGRVKEGQRKEHSCIFFGESRLLRGRTGQVDVYDVYVINDQED